MNRKMYIEYHGRDMSRREFLKHFIDFNAIFLHRDWSADGAFHIFTREAVKNIYDHNGGYGYCMLQITSETGVVICEIGNLDNPVPENNEHLETERNMRIGLRMLTDGPEPWFPLKIVCNADGIQYKYIFTYQPQTPLA